MQVAGPSRRELDPRTSRAIMNEVAGTAAGLAVEKESTEEVASTVIGVE
jgi:hypothetical protein